ncbi:MULTISPECIES: L-lysine 6-transaminase [unclassified Pedobacter]|uniref:L-lysine 6-transaminase n=1 Tax=unclassified Pedobacter TaxID=2628915 RepID=UPI001D2BC37C|nr:MULTISPECIES: L-lysine 6-transaminase [unclassified Pedobacter]CAH0255982.1 putative L-lysine-epsilon aminotransferase [Pedobacter sp. Bi36]CAH0283367.1 putative L-lysine-epsilon aminotransferase [Pedobacter sp. Bi126]
MYQLTVPADRVNESLSKHILADGFDLTYDMEKSHGAYIYDAKHNRTLLDFFTCFASVPLGYNHPKMINDETFKKNLLLAALANPSNSDVYTQQYAQFVETFSKVGIPDYLPHAFFIAGGGLAVENAIKVAMDWKVQKNFAKGYTEEKGFKVLHFERAFHGRTGYTLSLTNTLPDKTKWFAKFDWPRVAVPEVRFPLSGNNLSHAIQTEETSLAQIKKVFTENKDDICAIIVEPIQSEGGDNHLREEFLIQLKALADENDAFLIYDEVQTGVGLTGKFWCHQHFSEKARPDIIAFGKKMQVCGILVGNKVDEIETNVFKVPSRINSTWGGNLVDMVRSTQILQIVEEDQLCENAEKVGTYLRDQLKNLSHKFDQMTNVRGRGLLCSFDFPTKEMRNAFIGKGLENNVMFLGCGEKTIRFRPALCIEQKHIDEGLTVMEKILPLL